MCTATTGATNAKGISLLLLSVGCASLTNSDMSVHIFLGEGEKKKKREKMSTDILEYRGATVNFLTSAERKKFHCNIVIVVRDFLT